jgi:hypothetical protein
MGNDRDSVEIVGEGRYNTRTLVNSLPEELHKSRVRLLPAAIVYKAHRRPHSYITPVSQDHLPLQEYGEVQGLQLTSCILGKLQPIIGFHHNQQSRLSRITLQGMRLGA